MNFRPKSFRVNRSSSVVDSYVRLYRDQATMGAMGQTLINKESTSWPRTVIAPEVDGEAFPRAPLMVFGEKPSKSSRAPSTEAPSRAT